MGKKIYLVNSFGGEWEDSWEHAECAFTTKEDAEAYIKENEELSNSISDDLFNEISSFLDEKEEELWGKFHDQETLDLLPGASEEEYNKLNDDYHASGKYNLIKTKFGIDKDTWDNIEYQRTYDFCGYNVNEIELYNGRKC